MLISSEIIKSQYNKITTDGHFCVKLWLIECESSNGKLKNVTNQPVNILSLTLRCKHLSWISII